MTSNLDHSLSADEIGRALTVLGGVGPHVGSWAALLVAGDPLRVVWASGAAATLFGTADLEHLSARILSGRSNGSLLDSLSRLPPGPMPRLEHLRIVKGFRSSTVPVSLLRSARASGEPLYIVAVAASTQPQQAEPPLPPLGSDEAAHDVTSEITGTVVPSAPEAEDLMEDAPPERALDQAAAGSEAEAEHSDPVPVDPARETDELAGLRGRGTARFLWRTDTQNRLTELRGGFSDLFGFTGAGLIGEDLAAIATLGGSDVEARLLPALQSRTTWSGVPLSWPVTDTGLVAPVALGGVPVFTGDMVFDGFRGFGVLDLAGTAAGPVTGGAGEGCLVEPDGTPEKGTPEGGAARAGDAPEIQPPSDGGGRSEGPQASGEPTVVPTVAFSSKVVALHPHHWPPQPNDEASRPHEDPAGIPEPVEPPLSVPPEEAGDHASTQDLSIVEQSAFLEIGRLLDGGLDHAEEREPASDLPDGAPAPHPEPDGLAEAGPQATQAKTSPDLAVLIELFADAALLADEMRPVVANRRFLDLTGYASVEALGEAGGLAHLLDGVELQGLLDPAPDQTIAIVAASGERLAVEGRLQAAHLSGRVLEMLTCRLPSPYIRQAETLRQDLQRAEAGLAEARDALDSVPVAWVLADRTGRLLDANRAAEHLFGISRGAVIGQAFTTLLTTDNHPAALGLLASSSLEVGTGPTADVTARTPNGDLRGLRMTAAAIRGGRAGLAFQDTAAEQALRQDLAVARQTLEDEKSLRSDFLAKVSHEVRTPLNAILGFAEVILDERFGPLPNSRYRDYLRDIHESGTHVMNLVSDLLDLSRMEAGRMPMSIAPVDLNRIVAECVGEMQADAHRQRVIMRQSLLPGLPLALADARATHQIAVNILSNAVKFNEPGGQIIVSTAVGEGGRIALRVRDTGVGMSDDEVGLAIEPFRKIATGTAGNGSGLGLPLTKALVEANHATMTIKSRKREGTLVEVVFQAAPAVPMRVPAE